MKDRPRQLRMFVNRKYAFQSDSEQAHHKAMLKGVRAFQERLYQRGECAVMDHDVVRAFRLRPVYRHQTCRNITPAKENYHAPPIPGDAAPAILEKVDSAGQSGAALLMTGDESRVILDRRAPTAALIPTSNSIYSNPKNA